MKIFEFSIVAFCLLASAEARADAISALVQKAEDQLRGKTFQGDVEMVVDHEGNRRTLGMRIWTVGSDKATVKILAPKKERDTGNLRLKLELWQYSPNTEMVIKIPPSLMLQSWMGSDFTNDDLVRTSSLARDYTHVALGKEAIFGRPASKSECKPKNDAIATWGKVVLWIDQTETVPVKEEFYSENGELLKVLEGRNLKKFGTHTIPTLVTMRNAKKAGFQTTMNYKIVVFDRPIDDSIFTQAHLRRPATN